MIRKTRRRAKQSKTKKTRIQPRKPESDTHHYYSKIVFDGNKLTSEYQKDNEPVKRKQYTMKQLEQEIPIGKELIDEYLDGKVPKALQLPIPKEIQFNSVLQNPADLGLLPPGAESRMMRHRQRQRQRERERQHQLRRHDLTRRSSLANKNTIRNYNHDDRENMRIIVQDNSEDKYQKQQPLNLFDLP